MKKLIEKTASIFFSIGDFSIFTSQSFSWLFIPPFRMPMLIKQLYIIGINSIGIIALTSIGTSFIFTLQLVIELQYFNAPELAPNIIGHMFAREFAPLFTSLMIISKNGSAMTAEIGTMRITEQLDALRTMAIQPIQYLVGPRLLACIIMFPVLASFSNLTGLVGSAFIMFGLLKIDSAFAIDYMLQHISPEEVILGVSKSVILGIAVCLICCYFGFRCENSSKGVGDATTKAVVTASVMVIVLDFLLGKLIIDFNLIRY